MAATGAFGYWALITYSYYPPWTSNRFIWKKLKKSESPQPTCPRIHMPLPLHLLWHPDTLTISRLRHNFISSSLLCVLQPNLSHSLELYSFSRTQNSSRCNDSISRCPAVARPQTQPLGIRDLKKQTLPLPCIQISLCLAFCRIGDTIDILR